MPRKNSSSKNPVNIPAKKALTMRDTDSSQVRRKKGVKMSVTPMTVTKKTMETTPKIQPVAMFRQPRAAPTGNRAFNWVGKMTRRPIMNTIMPAIMNDRLKTRENGTRSDITSGQCAANQFAPSAIHGLITQVIAKIKKRKINKY